MALSIDPGPPPRPLILRFAGQDIITAADRARAGELLAVIAEHESRIEKYGHDRRRAYKAARVDYAKSGSQADYENLQERTIDLGDAEKARSMRSATRDALKAIAESTIAPFLMEIMGRASALVRQAADKLREDEEAVARSFGLALDDPSSTVKAAEQVLAAISERRRVIAGFGNAQFALASEICQIFELLGAEAPAASPPSDPAVSPELVETEAGEMQSADGGRDAHAA